MTSIVIDRFGGIAPRYDAFALPPFGAQIAQDTRLHGGVLKGFLRAGSLDPVVSVAAGTKSIFFDTGADNWFSWTTDVDCVLGPVADSAAARRYYYTGDGLPKKTDATMADTGASGVYPRDWKYLKVPTPGNAPTSSNNNVGAGTAEDHVYVVTFVSTFSGILEEGLPSPAHTVVAWQPGDTVTITRNNTPPTTNYNVTHWRIYRSNGGEYLFVDEVAIATLTYADSKLNEALGEAISTTDFDQPPDDLKSLVSMPNGILAGISGNEICFCEPYQPHAWPNKYRQPVADIPVALASVGQSLYVATEGRPAICTGMHPDSMSLEYSSVWAPCLSARSVASDGKGFMFSTYNGVAYMYGLTVDNMSEPMMTQEEWATFAPASARAVFYDGRYTLWYYVASDNFGAMHFDRTVQDAPMTLSAAYTLAAHVKTESGALYVVEDNEVKEMNADSLHPRTPFLWRSKIFQTPKPLNFAYGQVITDEVLSDAAAAYAARVAYNAAIIAAGGGAGAWNDMQVDEFEIHGSELITAVEEATEYVTLRVYADGDLVLTKSIDSDQPFKLPSGFKAAQWELEIMGTRPVRRVAVATSMEELQSQ